MKILITGSDGQVGTSLAKKLQGKAELYAVDRKDLDITIRDDVISQVSAFRPDYIINAAAHTAVDKAEDEVELSYLINKTGPENLAVAAQKVGAVLLHISTDYVFDGKFDGLYEENMQTGPQGIYGSSKLAGEVAVADNCARHLILRTAWVFGEYGNNFVKTMLRIAKSRDSISVVGDQFGGPTYAGDIADALISMIQYIEDKNRPSWGVYHFSGAPHVSWYQFAEVIFDKAVAHNVLAKKPLLTAINTNEYPTKAIRPSNSRLNCEKIFKQFNIQQSDWIKALEHIELYK